MLALAIFAGNASANVIDLTGSPFSAQVGGALFLSGSNTSNVGTGTFRSFVQIGTATGNQSITRAYNTTVNGVLDNGQADNFNHAIGYDDVSIVDVGGTLYRQFNLDTNDPNNEGNRNISITSLQVYLSNSPNLSTTHPSSLGIPIYDLDKPFDIPIDNSLLLDDNLNSGSGSGIDLVFLLPNSLFTAPGRYVYLYSEFSSQHGGFEEWSVSPCVSSRDAPCTPVRQESVPEPATLLLSGVGFAMLALSRRRSARREGHNPTLMG